MELNIRIAGRAGQGMATTAGLLGRGLTRSGLFAHCRNDAMSRIRGGLNFSHLRLSDRPLPGVSDDIDCLIAHSREALEAFEGLLAPDGVVICQEDWGHPAAAPFTLEQLAEQAGDKKTAGTAALAVLAALTGSRAFSEQVLEELIREQFPESSGLLEVNLKARDAGLAAAGGWSLGDRFSLPGGDGVRRLWLSGAQAISLGAVAGGVGFVAGYPMSPATGILAALASFSHRAGLVVEQAEDEIGAINMVAGAAFAGARSMTATSGGGLCLMTEGISLLGMIEAPAVIALASRPGPATGLPTRVAQGDLNLARFAGHGDFPRLILAPRSVRDCFEVTAQAFDLAEQFQGPVLLLTDQLLQDSYASVEEPVLEGLPERRWFLTAAQLADLDDYRRYAPAEDGLSPLAAPGVSRHVVVADSDEHDAAGHMVEAADEATAMVAKRQAKGQALRQAAWPPELEGGGQAGPLVVSWGSPFETVAEACRRLTEAGHPVRHLNLTWLWPLPEEELKAMIADARPLIAVEASTGCHIAGWLREACLREVEVTLSRLDGRPFTVNELVDRLAEEIEA